jgi:hypothetical protein
MVMVMMIVMAMVSKRRGREQCKSV